MRKVLGLFFIFFLLTSPAFTQTRTGNIYGTVFDEEGTVLPGVTVTLTGATIAPMTSITSAEGKFRFISLYPADDYAIKVELSNFNTTIHEGIVVTIGNNTELKLIMEIATLEEEVVVRAERPVVDSKSTTINQTQNYEMLQTIPSARDPWVILQMAAAVQADRENVGGSESGQQAMYTAKGEPAANSDWTLDGVVVGQPEGDSITYWDFGIFEEMSINIGGGNVESMTGGVALNMVSKRGGNNISVGGRYFISDETFQSKISDAKLVELGVPGYNRINEVREFGIDVGGPLWKDKAWFWGSFGTQETRIITLYNTKDETVIPSYTAKINLQPIPQNRLEAFVFANAKIKYGRNSSAQFPAGYWQNARLRFGTPIYKIQDEHMFGDDLHVSLKYGLVNHGWGMLPMNDLEINGLLYFNVEDDIYENTSPFWFESHSPVRTYSLQTNYYNDKLLGAAHEFKFGIDYTEYDDMMLVAEFPRNISVDYNIHNKTVDYDGDGVQDIVKDQFGVDIRRFYVNRNEKDHGEGIRYFGTYLSDTISFGRFSVKLGLRYDKQTVEYFGGDLFAVPLQPLSGRLENYYDVWQRNTTPGTAEKIAALLPDINVGGVKPDFSWTTLMPRIGIIYDVFGDGKTLAKLSGAMYAGRASWFANRWRPLGIEGSINFWWDDTNEDNIIDWRELYWASFDSSRTMYPAFDEAGNFQGNWEREEGYMWSGYNYQNPQEFAPPRYVVDPNWSAPRTYEILFTLEREVIPDLGAAVDFSYRRYDRFNRQAWYWKDTGHILDNDDYMVAGKVPSSITDPNTGETISLEGAAGRDWYVLKPGVTYTNDRYQTNWSSERYHQYYGITLRLNKRLSNKWMMISSFTWQAQKAHYGNAYDDPTNLWAFDNKMYAAEGWKSNWIFSRWLLKIQGFYQLPYDFNIGLSLLGREGYVIPAYITLVDSRLPNPISQSNTIYLDELGTTRLSNVWNMNIKLEKVLKISDRARIYLSADGFNVLNLHPINRRRDRDRGTYYVDTGDYSPYARYFEKAEILNPRVIRFGVRFQF